MPHWPREGRSAQVYTWSVEYPIKRIIAIRLDYIWIYRGRKKREGKREKKGKREENKVIHTCISAKGGREIRRRERERERKRSTVQ